MDIPKITSVEVETDSTVHVTFQNGEHGVLDMAPYMEMGVFTKLQTPAIFRSVKVAFNTLSWSGDIDLDPEFVYKKCKMLAK